MTIHAPDTRFLSFPTAGTGAVMATPDQRFLMQLRDDRPDVVLNGYWGVFGGEVETGEMPDHAMIRELEEELDYKVETLEYLCSVATDLSTFDAGVRCKHFYTIPISESDVSQMTLHEGERMALMTLQELTTLPAVVPTDLYALQLFAGRTLFSQRIQSTPEL